MKIDIFVLDVGNGDSAVVRFTCTNEESFGLIPLRDKERNWIDKCGNPLLGNDQKPILITNNKYHPDQQYIKKETFTVLIDGGEQDCACKIHQFLLEKGLIGYAGEGKGWNEIDLVIISHLHGDHMNGIRELFDYACPNGNKDLYMALYNCGIISPVPTRCGGGWNKTKKTFQSQYTKVADFVDTILGLSQDNSHNRNWYVVQDEMEQAIVSDVKEKDFIQNLKSRCVDLATLIKSSGAHNSDMIRAVLIGRGISDETILFSSDTVYIRVLAANFWIFPPAHGTPVQICTKAEGASASPAVSHEENDASIVLLFACNEFTYLTSGDMENEGERQIAAVHPVKTTVMKISHHGGETATPKEKLESHQPILVTLSTNGNSFGHPRAKLFYTIGDYIHTAAAPERAMKRLLITGFSSISVIRLYEFVILGDAFTDGYYVDTMLGPSGMQTLGALSDLLGKFHYNSFCDLLQGLGCPNDRSALEHLDSIWEQMSAEITYRKSDERDHKSEFAPFLRKLAIDTQINAAEIALYAAAYLLVDNITEIDEEQEKNLFELLSEMKLTETEDYLIVNYDCNENMALLLMKALMSILGTGSIGEMMEVLCNAKAAVIEKAVSMKLTENEASDNVFDDEKEAAFQACIDECADRLAAFRAAGECADETDFDCKGVVLITRLVLLLGVERFKKLLTDLGGAKSDEKMCNCSEAFSTVIRFLMTSYGGSDFEKLLYEIGSIYFRLLQSMQIPLDKLPDDVYHILRDLFITEYKSKEGKSGQAMKLTFGQSVGLEKFQLIKGLKELSKPERMNDIFRVIRTEYKGYVEEFCLLDVLLRMNQFVCTQIPEFVEVEHVVKQDGKRQKSKETITRKQLYHKLFQDAMQLIGTDREIPAMLNIYLYDAGNNCFFVPDTIALHAAEAEDGSGAIAKDGKGNVLFAEMADLESNVFAGFYHGFQMPFIFEDDKPVFFDIRFDAAKKLVKTSVYSNGLLSDGWWDESCKPDDIALVAATNETQVVAFQIHYPAIPHRRDPGQLMGLEQPLTEAAAARIGQLRFASYRTAGSGIAYAGVNPEILYQEHGAPVPAREGEQ